MRKLMIVLLVAFSASAAQKNVKVLTGLSDSDFHHAMNEMRASLGTHCDYCHVLKGQWDFPSDDNPMKNRAREMIRMVADINRTTFGGRAVVSCFTCHRGSVKPVNLVSLPQVGPPFPTPRPEKPALADAGELVKKYAAALGDVALLKTPRILKGERTSFTSADKQSTVSIEVMEKGANVHVLSTGKQTTEQALNGETGWWRNEKGSGDLKPAEVEFTRAVVAAGAIVLPADLGDEVHTIAKEKVNDRDAWVVERGARRFYFDVDSGLLVRAVTLTPTPVGTVPQQTDFEDYRDAGGVKFPFRIRVSFVDPWSSAMRQYTSVKLGAEVDDAVFEKPKAPPAAP